MDEDQKNLVNPRETLADVLESLLVIKRGGAWTVMTVVLGIACIGWLADSILPLLQAVSLFVLTKKIPDELNLKFSLIKLILPALWFLIYVGALFAIRHRKLKIANYKLEGSFPHRGLIISLSPLKGKEYELSTLEKQLDDRTLDLKHFFNNSNWGQLAFTIAHHSNLLQKCWICTTTGSTKQFPVAEKLINFVSQEFRGREVDCDEVIIEDENDLSLMATKVSLIYRNLRSFNLQHYDVIANYTGGTAAMTGGIIIATLNENREIEYVNQKYLGRLSFDLLRNNDQSLAIVTSKTNLVAAGKLNL